jgi:hypothetical protein
MNRLDFLGDVGIGSHPDAGGRDILTEIGLSASFNGEIISKSPPFPNLQ